jgi:hypothetical protein
MIDPFGFHLMTWHPVEVPCVTLCTLLMWQSTYYVIESTWQPLVDGYKSTWQWFVVGVAWCLLEAKSQGSPNLKLEVRNSANLKVC